MDHPDVPDDHHTEIDAARAFVEAYHPLQSITVNQIDAVSPVQVLSVRNGSKIVSVEEFIAPYRARPLRAKGIASFTTTGSLIDWIKLFADDATLIFADDDRKAPRLTAVLDYNQPSQVRRIDPRFGEHRGVLPFRLSDEWQAWAALDGKPMAMVEFAAFLEDRIIDVLALIAEDGDELNDEQKQFVTATGGKLATPAELLKLSLNLKVNESSAVAETRNLSSGEAEVLFASSHETQIGNEKVRVPSVFLIGVPVFRNESLYRVLARLRYRKVEGKLFFFYQLWRTDRVFDHAFQEACENVRVETGRRLLFGKPEA